MTPAHQLDPEGLGDHLDRLYRAAWALCGSREEAEDLVQDTYARVLKRTRIVRGDDDLGYLLRVLRNTFVSQRRAAARRPRPAGVALEDLELSDPRSGARPEQAAGAREVYAAISALPDDYRDALTAVDVVGLSYAEAARALRIPEGTLTSRVYRARAQVVRVLDPPSPAG
jgi:RNA polymerase sigma-70 factor, ECF subfamily